MKSEWPEREGEVTDEPSTPETRKTSSPSLPPEAPEELPPSAAADPSTGQPLKSKQALKGVAISVPGRFLQNSRNATVDTATQSSGNVKRRDRVNNNIGVNVDIQRRGGTTIRRNSVIESDNDTVRTRSSKDGTSDSTPAFSGHSHIQSGNKLQSSSVVDFGNQDTETEIVGNIGGRVRIVDEVSNLVEERAELKAAPVPAENHYHTHTTKQTTQYVTSPQLVVGYYYDAYGRLFYGPHYRY
jgi:hypothetical protein